MQKLNCYDYPCEDDNTLFTSVFDQVIDINIENFVK